MALTPGPSARGHIPHDAQVRVDRRVARIQAGAPTVTAVLEDGPLRRRRLEVELVAGPPAQDDRRARRRGHVPLLPLRVDAVRPDGVLRLPVPRLAAAPAASPSAGPPAQQREQAVEPEPVEVAHDDVRLAEVHRLRDRVGERDDLRRPRPGPPGRRWASPRPPPPRPARRPGGRRPRGRAAAPAWRASGRRRRRRRARGRRGPRAGAGARAPTTRSRSSRRRRAARGRGPRRRPPRRRGAAARRRAARRGGPARGPRRTGRSTLVPEVRFEQRERVHRAEGPDRGRPRLGRQLAPVLGQELAPRAVGRALRLEHRAVEVQEQRTDGGEPSRSGGGSVVTGRPHRAPPPRRWRGPTTPCRRGPSTSTRPGGARGASPTRPSTWPNTTTPPPAARMSSACSTSSLQTRCASAKYSRTPACPR